MSQWQGWRGKAKAGRTVRREVGRMNRTEAAYEVHLSLLERTGEVQRYDFERIKLRLADNTHYTPDFMVINRKGELEFHEVKGHMEDDAAVKIRVAADMFPFRFFIVKRDRTGWNMTEV